MARRTYRTAIVGTGGIGSAHAKAVRSHPGRGQLVAVVDVEREKAESFAASWEVRKVHASLTELLAAEELDVVHLCTPPATHVPLALECLRTGVHVLVEKPPALSLSEFDELARASAESGAHVATVFQHRFGSGALRLRALMASGALGRPMVATCLTLWYRGEAYFDVDWRGRWETEGGGPTMGHGIHQFDLMLSMLGPWESVVATAARRARHVDTEDVSMALVTFADGTLATVVNSLLSPQEVSRLRFDFERATVELKHLYGYSDADWTVTPAPGHEEVLQAWQSVVQNTAESGHHSQLSAVYDALDAGTAPPVTLADARNTLEFAAATYASAFTGRRVHCGEIDAKHPFAQRMDGTGAPWTPAK